MAIGFRSKYLDDLLRDPQIAGAFNADQPPPSNGFAPGMGLVTDDMMAQYAAQQSQQPAPPPQAPEPEPEPAPGYGDDEKPMQPQPVPITSGPVPSNAPAQPKKRTFWNKVSEIAPRMAAGAIAGGATQNVAGGGPVDIFRSMQAGRESGIQDQATQQKRATDILANKHTQAEIGQTEANTRYLDAEAQWRKSQAGKQTEVVPATDAYQKMIAATDPAEKEHWHQLWLESLGHVPKEPAAEWDNIQGIGEFNKRTSEFKSVADLEAQGKLQRARRLYGIPAEVSDDQAFKKLPKQVQDEIAGVKPPAEHVISEAGIIQNAAANLNDPVAQRAFQNLQRTKTASTVAGANIVQPATDKRQVRTNLDQGYKNFTTEAAAAENDFQKERRAEGEAISAEKLHDLESTLLIKKQNAQDAWEGIQRTNGLSPEHVQYPHPGTQHAAPPAAAPQAGRGSTGGPPPVNGAPKVGAHHVDEVVTTRDGRKVKIIGITPNGYQTAPVQ